MQNIQLSIPTPCHENWNNMTPSQQGRFCNTCAKQVVDFTSMSDKDVLNYFSSVKDKEVCGRAFPQQLERTIEMAPDQPKHFFYRYLNYAALLMLFFKASHAKAQGRIAVKPVSNKPVKHKLTDSNSIVLTKGSTTQTATLGLIAERINKPIIQGSEGAEKSIFTGYVSDEKGLPLPSASILVNASDKAITADSTGRFVLETFHRGDTVAISAVGYNDISVAIKESGQTIPLTKKEILLKEVVVESFVNSRYSSTMGVMISLYKCYKVKDSVINRIISFNPAVAFNPSVNIYPNPVVKGNMLHVSVNFKKEGQCSLQITDAAGRQVFQQSIQATTKNYLKELVAERSWGSGMFIIRITDAKNTVVKIDRFIAL